MLVDTAMALSVTRCVTGAAKCQHTASLAHCSHAVMVWPREQCCVYSTACRAVPLWTMAGPTRETIHRSLNSIVKINQAMPRRFDPEREISVNSFIPDSRCQYREAARCLCAIGEGEAEGEGDGLFSPFPASPSDWCCANCRFSCQSLRSFGAFDTLYL